jgi:hypothetical protein
VLGIGLELLLAESLRLAYDTGALRGKDLKRVTVDTTVQPKAISFPNDAKLLNAAIKALNRLATRHGLRLSVRPTTDLQLVWQAVIAEKTILLDYRYLIRAKLLVLALTFNEERYCKCRYPVACACRSRP